MSQTIHSRLTFGLVLNLTQSIVHTTYWRWVSDARHVCTLLFAVKRQNLLEYCCLTLSSPECFCRVWIIQYQGDASRNLSRESSWSAFQKYSSANFMTLSSWSMTKFDLHVGSLRNHIIFVIEQKFQWSIRNSRKTIPSARKAIQNNICFFFCSHGWFNLYWKIQWLHWLVRSISDNYSSTWTAFECLA